MVCKHKECELKSFSHVKGRELKRLQQACGKASHKLLKEKYGKLTEKDYNKIKGYHQWVTSTISIVSSIFSSRWERLYQQREDLSSFKVLKERSRFDIYDSGIRRFLKKYPHSHWSNSIIKTLQLNDFQNLFLEYVDNFLNWLRYFGTINKIGEVYLNYLDRSVDIAKNYSERDKDDLHADDLTRLYAYLKTWEDQEELDEFIKDLDNFFDRTVELYIEGPIRLYLKLSKDKYLIIFKAFTAENPNDLPYIDEEQKEVMEVHEDVYEMVEEEMNEETGFLYSIVELLKKARENYIKSLKEDVNKLKFLFPTQELRRQFIRKYECGFIFRENNPWLSSLSDENRMH
ncbi:MAG TPA: hypothetical protein PL110_16480 [Candidatus Eremiobacteraeota bacterium]|nr:MAG: hypothetical protein BWY64_01042 [bacterium ADurb.Bin363]HPZ09699.1 hypothetical protein [Candidatus Eremiobacteraeota bacterium]